MELPFPDSDLKKKTLKLTKQSISYPSESIKSINMANSVFYLFSYCCTDLFGALFMPQIFD